MKTPTPPFYKQKLGHAKLPHIHAAIKDLLDEMETKPAPAAPNNGHWTVPELTERLAALIAETPSLRGRLERYLAGYTDGKVKEDYLEAEQWVMDVIGKRSVAVNSIHEAIRNVLEARHA